jgi:hypothetical protein
MINMVLAACLLGAVGARADSRELYSLASIVPTVSFVRESGARSSARLGVALELSSLYGLDNELHIGGSLRVGGLKNATFRSASVSLDDGAAFNGALYEDALQISAAFAAAYRVDLSARWAPVIRVDVGMTMSAYSNRQLIVGYPAHDPPYGATLSTVRSLSPGGRIAFLVQRRLGDEWAIEAGLGLRAEIGSRGATQLELPLTAAWIF